jgi:MFS transporter, ACS family, hexuronate transporter
MDNNIYSKRYINSITVLLFITFGLVFMDKMSFTFLMPFIQKDLGLTNTASGLVLGVLSAFFGLSTIIFSSLSDVLGSKKRILVIFVLLFSVATLSVGVIKNLPSLIGIRAVMGITEGPVVPLILAIVLAISPAAKRGVNMGLVKGAGPLMSGVLAPLILIPIAIHYNWKWGFYTLAIPGFILAILLWKFLKEPTFETTVKPSWAELKTVFKKRNIILCLLISIFYMTTLISFVGFAPLYLANFKKIGQGQISVLLTAFGLGSFIWFFIIPAISDRWGRRPALILFSFLSMGLPLFMAFSHFGVWPTAIGIILLTCASGYMPLFDAIIPSESVPHQYAASVMAATILTGEVIGGTFGPILMGVMADKYDLRAAFIVGASAAFIAFLLSLGIKETKAKTSV